MNDKSEIKRLAHIGAGAKGMDLFCGWYSWYVTSFTV